MNKKGLSDIVTMVLIILLILVAIGIIWFFIKPFIFNSSEQLEGASSCFQTSIEPTKCEYTKGGGGERYIFLNIQRRGQAINLSGFNMIFTLEDGTYKTFTEKQTKFNITIPNQFETEKPIIWVTSGQTGFFKPRDVKITVRLGSKGKVCPPFSKELVCTEYVFAGDRSADMYSTNCARIPSNWTNGDDKDCFDIDYLARDPYADFNEDLVVNADDFRDFNSAYWIGQ